MAFIGSDDEDHVGQDFGGSFFGEGVENVAASGGREKVVAQGTVAARIRGFQRNSGGCQSGH